MGNSISQTKHADELGCASAGNDKLCVDCNDHTQGKRKRCDACQGEFKKRGNKRYYDQHRPNILSSKKRKADELRAIRSSHDPVLILRNVFTDADVPEEFTELFRDFASSSCKSVKTITNYYKEQEEQVCLTHHK